MLRGLAAVAEGAAMLHDDPARAATALDRAADELSPYSFASTLRARWGAAEARRRAGNLDAVPRLLAVEAQADGAGLVPLVARIHRSLRLAGVSRSAPRAHRSGLVTAQERQVSTRRRGLVERGLAQRLGVSRPRCGDDRMPRSSAPDRVAAAARSPGTATGRCPWRVGGLSRT
jgi:hypothetical protein